MKSISGKSFARILEKRGWILSRIKGSHHIYEKSGRNDKIILPIDGNDDLKIGLLKSLMKTAEIKESEL